jgi:hypothetical protein
MATRQSACNKLGLLKIIKITFPLQKMFPLSSLVLFNSGARSFRGGHREAIRGAAGRQNLYNLFLVVHEKCCTSERASQYHTRRSIFTAGGLGSQASAQTHLQFTGGVKGGITQQLKAISSLHQPSTWERKSRSSVLAVERGMEGCPTAGALHLQTHLRCEKGLLLW